jgi:hypothetical protein
VQIVSFANEIPFNSRFQRRFEILLLPTTSKPPGLVGNSPRFWVKRTRRFQQFLDLSKLHVK